MKKQLFSFVVMLALIVFAGTSAWAQAGVGQVVSNPIQQVVGSTTNLSFTATTGTTIAWTVRQADGSTYLAGGTTAAAASGTNYNWVSDATGKTVSALPTTASVFLKWLKKPDDGYTIYIVRMEESIDATGCSTQREIYVSIFDFSYDVYLSDATGANIEATTDITRCNTWDSKLIANYTTADGTVTPNVPLVDPLDGDNIKLPHANYVDNANGRDLKITPTYYTVEITLSGGTKTFDDIAMRVQYSLPTQTALSLYRITAPTVIKFEEGTTDDNIIEAAAADGTLAINTLTGANAYDYSGNNTFYIPRRADTKTTCKYTFQVMTHNNLGAAAMIYNIRVDKVDLDFHTTPTNYGNGCKVNYAVGGTGNPYANEPMLANGEAVSVNATINQSPATPIITITE